MTTCMQQLAKVFMTPIKSEYIVMSLRTIALVMVISLVYLIFQDFENNLSLIAALGVLISALLASYSVILNIDTTVAIKNREISDKTRFIFFKLCQIKMRLVALNNEKQREKVTYLDIDRLFDTIDEIGSMLSDAVTKDIISITHNDMLTDMHFLVLELEIASTSIKSIRKNTIKPEPQTNNQPIYNNPLITINFKTEDSIAKLTKILSYLKEGYTKDFKQDGAIEGCADYEYKKTIFELNEGKNK